MSQTPPRRWIARLFSSGPAAPAPSAQTANAEASEAANNRGALYAGAEGIPADYNRALECFRQAAEDGYAPAQTNLGIMFVFGRGVVRSEAEAGRWFRRAADQGDAGGQFNLGNLCHPASLGKFIPDAAEARIQAYMWFSLAAAQGYYKADMSSETLNMQMSNAELEESNRRRAAFSPRKEIALAAPRL